MDEVFILADPDCPRCKGKNKAELFAGEVQAIHDHLARKKRTLWIWGDRLLDDKTAKAGGPWEADQSGTHPAIDKVSKDIVICDWHYGAVPATASHFAGKGFAVISSPWRNSDVALQQLKMIRQGRRNPESGARFLGMLQTTWCGAANFIRAYNGDEETRKKNAEAAESAECFRKLFAAMRQEAAEGMGVFGAFAASKEWTPPKDPAVLKKLAAVAGPEARPADHVGHLQPVGHRRVVEPGHDQASVEQAPAAVRPARRPRLHSRPTRT